ncbi:MAG TPA: PBP1A family penicillin-binding protein, partial [Longimicrobiales bacterium]|nr:PBP1A family penicillin-binding protein [Longimicrobiales bacterium]
RAGAAARARRFRRQVVERVRARRFPLDARQTLALGITLILVGFLLWERCGLAGCPSVRALAAYQPGGAPILVDRDGERFADLAPVDREVVPLDELPEHVTQAFLAVEDRRFREHRGVDWRRIPGAVLANVRAGGVAQGFSTITMQLARNVFPERLPGQERTLRRKLMEIRVAGEIEETFTKDEILQLYLNHIYFGGGAYGIQAAARSYFGKDAADLDLEEAAVLAAMPKGPNLYNPRRHPERTRERRDLVLTLMENQELITAEEASEARDRRLRVRSDPPRPSEEESVAPYFARAVRRSLEARFGDELYAAPLVVHTTLDRRAQRILEEELERQLRAVERGGFGRYGAARFTAASTGGDAGTEYLQGAGVILDAHTGEVLALVGGRDYASSAFDRATSGRRQAGSAFKPFVFAAALADGYAPSQLLSDEPLRMELAGGEVWEPRNFTGVHQERVTLREALVQSKNVPTVRLAAALGTGRVASVARDAGIRSDISTDPSMALGTVALSPLELATAYTALASGGTRVEPRLVVRVEAPGGKVMERTEPRHRRVMDEEVAYLLTDMLRDAVRRGTGDAVRAVGFDGPAAGKTGTTNEATDVWFAGYTPELVSTIWMGFDQPRPIVPRASGGSIAAPIWGRTMRRIYARRDMPAEWPRPDGVVERSVDPASGLVLREGCRPLEGGAQDELFIAGDEPATVCPAGDEEGPGVLAWLGARLRSAWNSVADFVGGLFRGEEDDDGREERRRRDELLGAPRLPRAVEVREREEEPELLGEPYVAPSLGEAEMRRLEEEIRRATRDDLEGLLERMRELEGGALTESEREWVRDLIDVIEDRLEEIREGEGEARGQEPVPLEDLDEALERQERGRGPPWQRRAPPPDTTSSGPPGRLDTTSSGPPARLDTTPAAPAAHDPVAPAAPVRDGTGRLLYY